MFFHVTRGNEDKDVLRIAVTLKSLKDPNDTVILTDVRRISNYWSTERNGSNCIELKSESRGVMNVNLKDYRVVIEKPTEDGEPE